MGDRLTKALGWVRNEVLNGDSRRIPRAWNTPKSGVSPRLSRRAVLAGMALLLVSVLGAFEFETRFAPRAGREAGAPVPYPHDLAQVSFAVAGDVIPHEAVRAAAAADGEGVQGWSGLLSEVSDVFRSADFGFVNLETPVAPAHSHGSKPFMFDAPVVLPEALKANGIKIVSFANNHVMDQGWAGFAETREHLREMGLLFVGSGDTAQQTFEPVIVEANGIKVGWLGMTRWLNGNRNPDKDDQPHVNFFPYPGESGGAPGARRSRCAGRHQKSPRPVRHACRLHSLGNRIRARTPA